MIGWFWLVLAIVAVAVMTVYLHRYWLLAVRLDVVFNGAADNIDLVVAQNQKWQVLAQAVRVYVLAAEGTQNTNEAKFSYAYDRLQDASMQMLGYHLGNLEAEGLIEGEVQRLQLEVAAAARGVRIG